MRHIKTKAGACIACLLASTALASADSTDAELQELRNRIDALEAQQAELEAQQTVSTAPEGFRLNTVESLGDPDQIGDRFGLGRLSFGIGESTAITIYGFVRAEAFYDFDFSQGDVSDTAALTDPGNATNGNFEQSARVSRFGIRSKTNTGIGDVSTQLEFDLFSEDSTTGSPDLRLRHANIRVKNGRSEWLLGQFWTNFMPLVHYPTSADFNGPVGITFARVPQIRYTFDNGNGLQLSAALEDAQGFDSEEPVLTAAAFYGADRWSARVSTLYGNLPDGNGGDVNTYGVTLSGSVSPWNGGTFTGTYTTGESLGNLLIGPGDAISDVGGVPTGNDVDAFTLEFRQDITDKINVGIAYGREDYDFATDLDPGTTNPFDEVSTIHVNAFYTPVENFTFALEYIYAEVEGPGGFQEDANRIGFSATFRF